MFANQLYQIISVVYTFKVINVRLFLGLKIRKNGRKQQKKGGWAAVPTPNTDSEVRYRHRYRVRKANNGSLWKLKASSKKAGCPAPERTIVQSEAELPARGPARCPEGERTIIRFTLGRKLGEKRTKKTRATRSGFKSEQSPFLCNQ